jgi:hypothetical protein
MLSYYPSDTQSAFGQYWHEGLLEYHGHELYTLAKGTSRAEFVRDLLGAFVQLELNAVRSTPMFTSISVQMSQNI